MGIYVVYFLDYCVGGVWWLVFVYLMQVIAVFMVRGRPYSGDTVVTALFVESVGTCVQSWLAPLLSFTWNVILPVALMVRFYFRGFFFHIYATKQKNNFFKSFLSVSSRFSCNRILLLQKGGICQQILHIILNTSISPSFKKKINFFTFLTPKITKLSASSRFHVIKILQH